MKKRILWIIAKKEFTGYFKSPLAYTIMVPFLLISVFLYMRIVLGNGDASLRPYFEYLPWFLLLLAPALAMKLLSDERRSSTLELLFAHPISELEIVIGKFLGALAFYGCILLTTIGLPLSLMAYSSPDIGQLAGQYVGALFVGAAFLSIGLAASAYVKNAISSFLVAAAISFVILVMGMDIVTQAVPFPLNRLLAELSVLPHMRNIARGLLDIRDIVYFLTVIGFFLLAAVGKLAQRRVVEKPMEKHKLRLALGFIVASGLLINVFLSFYPLRLDLTTSRLFTLSKGTKQTLGGLPDIVTVTVYASRDLPVELQTTSRQISDMLKDYQKYGKRLQVKIVYPDTDEKAAAEAQTAGIQAQTFNTSGASKLSLQKGYLGIAMKYGDKTETIPYVADTNDLEYQLTRRLRKLTDDKQKSIGLFTNGQAGSTQFLEQVLGTQYEVTPITSETKDKLKDVGALIVIDDGSKPKGDVGFIKEYLNNKGKLLLLVSGVTINQQTLAGTKGESPLLDTFADIGIKINKDLAYDLQTAEVLTLGSNEMPYQLEYPYWFRALPKDSKFGPLATVKSISMLFPSSLSIEEKDGYSYRRLITTSAQAGKTENEFKLSPETLEPLKANSRDVLLAASVEKDEMRLVVVSASSVVVDQVVQASEDNASFIANTVDYLAADKDVAAIPSKSSGRAVFEFSSKTDEAVFQYGNLLVPPVIIVGFAVWQLRRRKLLTKRTYVQPTT